MGGYGGLTGSIGGFVGGAMERGGVDGGYIWADITFGTPVTFGTVTLITLFLYTRYHPW